MVRQAHHPERSRRTEKILMEKMIVTLSHYSAMPADAQSPAFVARPSLAAGGRAWPCFHGLQARATFENLL